MDKHPSQGVGLTAAALLLVTLLACRSQVALAWEPNVSRAYEPICGPILRSYPGDIPQLMAARAIIIGEVYANGGVGTGDDDMEEAATWEALNHGGTHYIITDQALESVTIPISGSTTRCRAWGGDINCTTQPPTKIAMNKPSARYVVIRVEREHWAELPPELRPVCSS